LPHGIDLIVSPLNGPRSAAAEELRFNPDRKELRIKPAFLGPDRVEVTISEPLRKIDLLVEQALRSIGVHIDGDSPTMN
jgi:hypothetical protein